MSETNTQATSADDPQPNAPSVDPPAPASEPEPGLEPAPAPPPAEPTGEEKEFNRGDRRFAALSARTAALQRERDQLAAELRARGGGQPPYAPTTPEQQEAMLRAQIRAEEAAKIRAERFHEEGGAAFPDWQKRCGDLMAMGADAGFAQVLVEMPGGTRVAAALADDPEAVERISAIQTERGRAIALGRYAATLETATGATARTQSLPVTKAPAPIRPVTGRASPQFDEYRASAQELVDHYLKPTPISVRR